MTTLSVKRQCGRCPREEHIPIDIKEAVELAQRGELEKPANPAITVFIDGTETVSREHLCGPCREIVARLLEQIGRKLEHRSSLRTSGEEGVELEDG